MPTQIKVKRQHDYAGKPRKVDSVYAASKDHAKFLIENGFAVPFTPETPKKPEPEVKKPTYETASLTADTPKRAYARRDMTSSESKE